MLVSKHVIITIQLIGNIIVKWSMLNLTIYRCICLWLIRQASHVWPYSWCGNIIDTSGPTYNIIAINYLL